MQIGQGEDWALDESDVLRARLGAPRNVPRLLVSADEPRGQGASPSPCHHCGDILPFLLHPMQPGRVGAGLGQPQ